MVIRVFTAAAAAALCAAGSAAAEGVPAAGFVASEYPFRVGGAPARRTATVLAGEEVETGYLPARLRLAAGARLILGPGSAARTSLESIRFRGGSLEVLRLGSAGPTIQFADLEIVAGDGSPRFVLYADRPDRLYLRLLSGAVGARGPADEAPVEIGDPGTWALRSQGGRAVVSTSRAALEIARIQIRQYHHLGALHPVSPALEPLWKGGINRLLEAAAGALTRDRALFPDEPPVTSGDIRAQAVPDPVRLLVEIDQARADLHRSGLDLVGCGNPSCASLDPPAKARDVNGNPARLPLPAPGCGLCREVAEDDDAVEDFTPPATP